MFKLPLSVFALALCACAAATPTLSEINAAIRNNDISRLAELVKAPGAANLASGIGYTPLHHAALYGSLQSLKVLLQAGANPNASMQSGVTPLIFAAWDFERTRMLVEHGAAVKAVPKNGVTALHVAASAHGGSETVRFLLDKGADVNALDEDGADALMRAAMTGDAEVVELLLQRGADPKRIDKSGFNALGNAMTFSDSRRVKALLSAGADANVFNTFGGRVKNGPIALVHLNPLMLAAPYGDQESITALLKAGAKVNETDSRKMTALMFAIATDHAHPETVRALLEAGSDINLKDQNGDTALDWARRYGNPEIISMLERAGAQGRNESSAATASAPAGVDNPTSGMNRTVTLFKNSDFFRAGGGCAGCHHQPAYARAYASVRSLNINAAQDGFLRTNFLNAVVANRPRLFSNLPFLNTLGGDVDSIFPFAVTSAELNEPATEVTDLVAHYVAMRQDASGKWTFGGVARPPLEESDITRTAYGIVTLSHYSWPARKAEFQDRVRRAKDWLESARPETTYEHAERIWGLNVAGVAADELRSDADVLIKLQRQDGGWAQTRYLESDAYATGMVLDTLVRTGLLSTTDPAFNRGISFLLRTQYPDGSWHVRSRAVKFQPYFQSGFPFEHDQWISSVGSAWAVMALSHAVTLQAKR